MASSSLPAKVPDAKSWEAFAESQTSQRSKSPLSNVKPSGQASSGGYDSVENLRAEAANGYRRQQHGSAVSSAGSDTWGFVQDSFTSMSSNLQTSKASGLVSCQIESTGSPPVYDSNSVKSGSRSSGFGSQSQPAGWAGF